MVEGEILHVLKTVVRRGKKKLRRTSGRHASRSEKKGYQIQICAGGGKKPLTIRRINKRRGCFVWGGGPTSDWKKPRTLKSRERGF